MRFIVNQVVEENGVTHGITTDHDIVLENFRKIFGKRALATLIEAIKYKKSDFYLIERSYQYVVHVSFKKDRGLSMRFSDFKKNMDKVLDEYLELEARNWEKESRDKYVRIAQEIIDDQRPRSAKLIVKPITV